MNNLQFSGDYKFNYAKIGSYNGVMVDIMPMILGVEIFEDVYSPFISIELTIEDQAGLYHKIPLVGEELLQIDIRDVANEHGYKDFQFYIYKTKDFVQKGDRGFVYKICGISIEAVKDVSLKISKAYSGIASDIAKSLLKEEALETEKILFLEESIGNIEYISNYWSPIKNIKYLTQRAIAKENNAPSYLFFENKMGFTFSSLNALINQESVCEYFFSVNANQNLQKRSKQIEKIWIENGPDYLTRVAQGAYGSNVLWLDPTKKSYHYTYYDFLQAFDERSRLNEFPFSTNDATRRPNSNFIMNTTPTDTKENMRNEYSETWFQQRQADLGAMQAFRIQIQVSGLLHIAVGMTTDLYMFSGDGSTTASNINEVMDKVYSGKYLITSVRHSFDRKRHTMNLGLSKDSLIRE